MIFIRVVLVCHEVAKTHIFETSGGIDHVTRAVEAGTASRVMWILSWLRLLTTLKITSCFDARCMIFDALNLATAHAYLRRCSDGPVDDQRRRARVQLEGHRFPLRADRRLQDTTPCVVS